MPDHAYADELILWKSPIQYHRNWQNRCESCLAPCCFFSMHGYPYNYKTDPHGSMQSSRSFFTNDFVILGVRYDSFDEQIDDWGFKLPLAMGEELDYTDGNKALQICPLNVNSKCLIYEDRPKMCRVFKCNMKTVEGNTPI